jgi:hypothetical protein
VDKSLAKNFSVAKNIWALVIFVCFREVKKWAKNAFWPKKVGKWPKIFEKWAAKNRCGSKRIRICGQKPTFFLHFI